MQIEMNFPTSLIQDHEQSMFPHPRLFNSQLHFIAKTISHLTLPLGIPSSFILSPLSSCINFQSSTPFEMLFQTYHFSSILLHFCIT